MKTSIHLKRIVVATGFALAIMAGAPIASHHLGFNGYDMISQAHAVDDGGGKGKMGSSGKGSGSKANKGTSDHGTGSDHGKKDVKVTGGIGKGDANRDVDSDRPATAGVKGGKGGGGGQPAGSGSKKGDLYGDLYVVLRNPVTGAPILNAAGQVQPVDINGNPIPLNADGTPVDKNQAIEVEFGRLSVARAPANVTEHSLTEALSKLTDPAAVVTLDAAGRLVITVAGVAKTIDSPLENLALYKAIANLTGTDRTISVTATAKDGAAPVTYTYTVPASVNIDMLKASLLAAAGDKYGTITLDTVMYLNPIVGVTDNLSAVTYDRATTYDGKMVTVLVKQPDGITYIATSVNLYTAVFNRVNDTTATGAADFATAVNDALQVLEFVHDNEVR